MIEAILLGLTIIPANLQSYPPNMALMGIAWYNLLFIIPTETVGALLVSRSILRQRLRFGRLVGLVAVANLVTAVLGYPVVLRAGMIDFTPDWLLVFYVLTSVAEGTVYMFMLRRTELRFDRVFSLAAVVNLFTYIPTFLLSSRW